MGKKTYTIQDEQTNDSETYRLNYERNLIWNLKPKRME